MDFPAVVVGVVVSQEGQEVEVAGVGFQEDPEEVEVVLEEVVVLEDRQEQEGEGSHQ